MTDLSPEEIELSKKRRVLERLQTRLVEEEESILEFREELKIFEARYTRDVARFYSELDEIEAQIAAEEARLAPDDWEIQRKAEEAKKRAEESAAATAEENWQGCSHKFNPAPHLKKAYHRLAKLIRPDLAASAEERERRTALMAEANDAFAAGNENVLFDLLEQHRDSPDLIRGDWVGEQLVRAIRQIYAVKRRLEAIAIERVTLQNSEKYELLMRVEAEMRQGRNLLNQMTERTKTHIKRAERRLQNLRQSDISTLDANEHYDMNVSMFR